MISEILKHWIAQSESWQTFIDFKLPADSIARYKFLDRPDDFYISLFGSLYDILENPEATNGEILSIAKGLEIYSLKNKKNSFNGIDQANNILFASGLYYLSSYSSSASILANLFSFEDYQTDIEKFLLSFLTRKELKNNPYRDLLDKYLQTGNYLFLNDLLKKIENNKESAFKHDPYQFSIYYLTGSILAKFKTENIWSNLLKYNNDIDHWKEYITNSITKKFPIWDFFPSQRMILEKGLSEDYKSIALQTPTSSGKTAICELLIYNELKTNLGCKILYLAPFRALASELKQSFGKNLSELGISSKTIYGGAFPTIDETKAIQDINLLISTPEKFMAIENIDPNFSKNFTMVICDEGHLLDDYGARGLSYELLLSRFKKENNKKFIFLSAIIPNIIEINKWLGGDEKDVAKSNYRATEIEYAFLKPDKSGKKFHLEVNPLSSLPKKYILNNFLTEKDLQYTEQLKTKIKTRIDTSFQSKSAIIALKALHSGTVAIFVPKKGYKGGVEGVTKEIIRQLKNKSTLFNDLNLQKPTDDKIILKKYFQIIFGDEYLLTQIIDYGILFHHGDLPQYVREIIEDYIRDEKIKLIICTNTLAEGVNLPIRTIIVNSTRRDHRLNPDLRDLKNLFGRAGRAGKETKGLIIIPNPNDFQIVKNVIKGENIQEVKGFLYKIIQIIEKYAKAEKLILTNDFLEEQNEDFKELIESIDTSIIDLLEESIDIEKFDGEIQNLINNTFASYQANKEEKNILNILIKLRGEKIKPYIKTEEFSFIKKSSSTLRIYEELKSKLELTNPIWKETNTPTNEKWLNFIVSIISELSIVKYRLELFNKKNFQTKKSEYLTFEDIKTAITLWLKGKWFKDISTICSNDINISLRLIKFITEYNIQNVISTIIHIVELKLKTESKVISQVILDFPQYLLYGLEERLQLDLIEIGFTDRIGIIELSRMTNKVEYSKLRELKSILKYNEEEIISFLKNKLPQLSLAKIKDSFNFLRYDNIQ